MKLSRLSAAAAALAAVAIQIVKPEAFNPSLPPERSIAARADLPRPVALALDRACADCHSNETRWPWYSRVAPASWLVAEHVNHGRRHLNFSDWASRSPGEASRTLDEMCREVRKRRMPLRSYLLLHRDARLTDEEIGALCDWTKEEIQRMAISSDDAVRKIARRIP